MIEKGDIIFFDNPFSLRHNLCMLYGEVVGIFKDSVLAKTPFGVTEILNKHIIEYGTEGYDWMGNAISCRQ